MLKKASTKSPSFLVLLRSQYPLIITTMPISREYLNATAVFRCVYASPPSRSKIRYVQDELFSATGSAATAFSLSLERRAGSDATSHCQYESDAPADTCLPICQGPPCHGTPVRIGDRACIIVASPSPCQILSALTSLLDKTDTFIASPHTMLALRSRPFATTSVVPHSAPHDDVHNDRDATSNERRRQQTKCNNRCLKYSIQYTLAAPGYPYTQGPPLQSLYL